MTEIYLKDHLYLTPMVGELPLEREQAEYDELVSAQIERNNPFESYAAKWDNYPLYLTPDDKDALENGWTAMAELKAMGVTDEERLKNLGMADSPSELRWRMANEAREERNLRLVSEASLADSVTSAILAEATNPLTLAAVAFPLAKTGGLAVRAASGGLFASADLMVSEALNHSTQEERTLQESLMVVGTAGLLGSVFGATLGSRAIRDALSPKEIENMVFQMEENLQTGVYLAGRTDDVSKYGFPYNRHLEYEKQDEIFRMVKTNQITEEEAYHEIWNLALDNLELDVGETGFQLIKKFSPMLHGSLSRNPMMRAITERMSESSLLKVKHFKGIRNEMAIDTLIEMTDASQSLKLHEIVRDAYLDFTGGKMVTTGDVKARISGGVTLEQFKEKIATAYRMGGKSGDEMYDAIAQRIKTEVMEPYEARLVAAEMVDPANIADIRKWREDAAKWQDDVDELNKELRWYDEVLELEGEISGLKKKLADPKTSKSRRANATTLLAKRREALKAHSDMYPEYFTTRGAVRKKEYKATLKQRDELQGKLDAGEPKKTREALAPVGSEWYLPRVYRQYEAYQYKEEFINAAASDIQEQLVEAANELKTAEGRAAALKQARALETYEDIKREVTSAWGSITRKQAPVVDVEFIGRAFPVMKKRKLRARDQAFLNVPVRDGKNVNFIETDIVALQRGHLRMMTPKMIFKEQKFDFTKELEKALEWGEREAELLRAKGDIKGASKLIQDTHDVAEKLNTQYEHMTRQFKALDNPMNVFNRARHVIQNYNIMRMLGGMTISAMTDVGNLITHTGLKASSRTFAKLASSPKDMKMAFKHAKKLGLVAELVTASRLHKITMTDDMAPNMGVVSRLMSNASKTFATATGMNHWNAGMKEFIVLAYADELLTLANKPISKLKAAKFAQAGLNVDDIKAMRKWWEDTGAPEANGVKLLNPDEWIGEDGLVDPLAERVMAVLKKEADTGIVTPAAGDLPLVMRHPVGAMIGQFKSFSFTAVNKILLPSIQRMRRGDVDAVMGMVTQLGLGAAVYGLKSWGAGREVDTSWETLTREMVDRSGYFGIFADINAISEKMTAGKVGFRGLIGGGDLSRYYARSAIGDLAGPTFGTINDFSRFMSAMFREEVNRGDLSAMRRLLPYQNLFWIRKAINAGEDEIADQLELR